MVIVPSAPVILGFSFGLEWEVVQNSADVPIACANNAMQVVFRISLYIPMSIGIYLFSQHSSNFNHNLGKGLHIFFDFGNLIDPNVPNIHLDLFGGIIFLIVFGDGLRAVSATIHIITTLGCIIFALELLHSA